MDGTGIAALCRSMGWTYGVIWRIDRRDPRLLTLEGSYYEGKSGRIFEKMIKDVHVIGQGTIGEIAVSGKYRWINFHSQSMQSCEIGADVKSGMLKNYTEWQHQILAGLKTAAVISQPGLGVILFGSTQKILESPNLVEKAQHLLLQLAKKQFLYDHADWNSNHQHPRLASVISFMDSSTFKNNILTESFDRERWDCPSSTYSPSLDPELISPGSQVFSLSASSGSSNGLSNLFRGSPSTSSHSSHQFANQQTASKKARLLSECNDSSSTFYKSNIRAKEIHSSSSMDVSGVLNMIPTFSCSSTPCSDTFHVHRAGNSLELQHCSSSPVSVCSISTVISSLKPFPQAHDEPMNIPGTNHIDSSGQSDDRVNNSFSEIHKVCDSFTPDSVQSWNENTSPAPSQIVSDVDIFDGMEFDLSPIILMKECWEDILPADSNSCTDFSTKISDCLLEFELGSVACASNELVPADANVNSSCDSVVTATSSVVSGSLNIQTPELSFSQCRPEKSELESLKDVQRKFLVCPWIDDSCSVNAKDSRAKVVRKRARPGESTRPRPKDRQQIQDRLKELREIVPNGAKCSIDALLELTIRHMIFLRNVMEYSDKLKLAEGPKMLCEERGFFLEIADIVRGFGLTILKGVLEIRGTKIWARFLLEVMHNAKFQSIASILLIRNDLICSAGKHRCYKNGYIPVSGPSTTTN
ncbi:Transcription factor bHLH155 [Platanthera guangdongensis]|uniref:Transcription factor bHLH155 n=1 Tax=Platanthera guangdongensis TaxID=2320717 RepID=A0ABR2MXU1_9ASPA